MIITQKKKNTFIITLKSLFDFRLTVLLKLRKKAVLEPVIQFPNRVYSTLDPHIR